MVELESREAVEPSRDALGHQELGRPDRGNKDRLLIAILGSAILLAILIWGTAVIWGTGPVLTSAPWYIPLIGSSISLIAFLIGYLALGRYQVLRDPVSFWVGSGYLVYGLGQIFYALTWPGLLPNGDPIIGHQAGTSAWIALVDLTFLEIFLLAAVLDPWPNRFSLPGNQWRKPVLTFFLIAAIFFGASLLLENYLPDLVDENGVFTPLQRTWVGVLLCFFVLGCTYAILYYQRSHDRLVGFIAFPQMALVFVCMIVLLGGKRYDLWWYVHRVVLVGGHLGVLYGLLSEYVHLLKRESEGRRMLEAILENIPVGLAVTGGPPDYSVARISRHGSEKNGQASDVKTEADVMTGTKNFIQFSGQDAELTSLQEMPLYRASHFGEETRNMELTMVGPDGSKSPVLVNAAPIHDIQGNIVAAISTWLDITDRKLAEQRLQESEALYRAIARSIPHGGIFVVDRNLRYIIAEGVVAEDFGVSKKLLEGHTVSEIFDREVSAKMEARFHRAFDGEMISYETEHNGRIYWTQHAVMDDPGGHAIVITMDVTERKRAEKALSESEQRFRAIINQATAGIIRTDLQGRSLFVNQALCEMLGCTESDLVNETLWKYSHPDDIEESQRLFERLREKGKPFHLEERLIRKDGALLWVNVSAAPILDEVDKPQSAVFIVVDITERKSAEEALQKLNLELESRVEARTAELQAANWALFESRRRLQILSQRLVDIQEEERRAIARELHDRVGQTLTALNLNLTIVGDQLASQATAHITERLADSIKLVTEMISIVRDVMSDLRPIVLDEYGLEAALEAYRTKFEDRYGIQVDFDRSNRSIPHLGAGLEMTILRIAQEALLNIARHAHADHVTLTLQCDDGTLLLSVEDNGVGIQSWHASAESRSGHGLMLMRERAEAVGGSLKVTSLPSKGTRIEAYLPYENNSENNVEKEGLP